MQDVECGNAAGTASCLVAGGGNEKPGANIAPPAGAVPTFAVQSLSELRQLLVTHTRAAAAGNGNGGAVAGPLRLGWPALQAADLCVDACGEFPERMLLVSRVQVILRS